MGWTQFLSCVLHIVAYSSFKADGSKNMYGMVEGAEEGSVKLKPVKDEVLETTTEKNKTTQNDQIAVLWTVCQVITKKDVVRNKLQADFLLGTYLQKCSQSWEIYLRWTPKHAALRLFRLAKVFTPSNVSSSVPAYCHSCRILLKRACWSFSISGLVPVLVHFRVQNLYKIWMEGYKLKFYLWY